MEQPRHIECVALPQRRLDGVSGFVTNDAAVSVGLDEVIGGTQVVLGHRIEPLLARHQLDGISWNDILQQKQDERNAQKDWDELQNTLYDVSTHVELPPRADPSAKVATSLPFAFP